jgi:hypothetical protein
MSVPYALYSNKADSSKYASNGLPGNSTSGDMMYYNGTTWVKLAAGGYGQSLVMCDGVPAWGGCVPKVATGSSSAVSYTSLTTGGNVVAEGGFSVSSRGVCWSTSPNPTVTLTTKTIDGAGIGNFTSSITGLTPNTTYYVRAYATNSVGTDYGADSILVTNALAPPTINTTTVSGISYTSANCGGSVTNDGGTDVTVRGVCWSTSPNPTVALSTKTADGTGAGTFASSITGLTGGTTYYVRAYATNSVGTAYGTQQTFTTTIASSITIGQTYAGGIVFYIDGTGQHGLVCAPNDQGTAPWGCYGTSTGATGLTIGTGASNSAAIVTGCAESSIAAKLCDNLVLNGYSDWYLPSRDELKAMYQQLKVNGIGNFVNDNYWSSSESSFTYAWYVNFSNGNANDDFLKFFINSVRAVRAF